MAQFIVVNLEAKKVRIYDEHGNQVAEFSNVVTGPHTTQLLHHKKPFKIKKFFHDTSHGLIHFVQISGNFGFHSDHWHHDKRHPDNLTKIPGAHSHGCVRIPHDDSKVFFDAVEDGDLVQVYKNSWGSENETPGDTPPQKVKAAAE